MINNWIDSLQEEIENTINFMRFLGLIDKMNQDVINSSNNSFPIAYVQSLLLKVSNILVGKYQYRHCHSTLVSRPFGLIVDPANNCHLRCPGCLHNQLFSKKVVPDWPNGLMSEETFRSFIEQYGPYATTILFYNWGEPLLNKHTPQFIKLAKTYFLNTSLSSNLSIHFDHEALVCSGLDYMILSIDGATPATYNIYRNGGNFDLVIKNVEQLVAAKEKYKSEKPYISWQFLLFEHNCSEIEVAKRMAEKLGVNEIRFAQPYDIPWRPDLNPARDVLPESHVFSQIKKTYLQLPKHDELNLCTEYDKLWAGRDYEYTNIINCSGTPCKWLYQSMTMDALGRIFPCCYAPRKKYGMTFIYSSQSTDSNIDHFNSDFFQYSRSSFVEMSKLSSPVGKASQLVATKHAPYCVACPDKQSQPLVNEGHLSSYLHKMNCFNLLSEKSINTLASW